MGKNINYNFEWDYRKAKSNQNKHGVSFEEASTVFRDLRAISIYDNEHSEKQDRWITIGISNKGRLIIVFHTFQKENKNNFIIRMYSSQKASKKEIEQYGE